MTWKWEFHIFDPHTGVEFGPYNANEVKRFETTPFAILRKWVKYDCNLRNQNTTVVTIY